MPPWLWLKQAESCGIGPQADMPAATAAAWLPAAATCAGTARVQAARQQACSHAPSLAAVMAGVLKLLLLLLLNLGAVTSQIGGQVLLQECAEGVPSKGFVSKQLGCKTCLRWGSARLIMKVIQNLHTSLHGANAHLHGYVLT